MPALVDQQIHRVVGEVKIGAELLYLPSNLRIGNKVESQVHDIGSELERLRSLAQLIASLLQIFAQKLGLTFPIAFELNAEKISRATGGFYDQDKKYLQPTNIIVRPDKTVEIAAYSSGAVGRFAAKDVLSVVKYYKSQLK